MRTGGEAHAQFVGDKEAEEKRWFMFAAKTPGVSVTSEPRCRSYLTQR